MRTRLRGWLALAMAMGLVFSSSCTLLPTDDPSSSDHSSRIESSISSSDSDETSSIEEDSSSEDSSSAVTEYKLLASQTSYSMQEEEVTSLKVRLMINGAIVSPLEGVRFVSENPSVATVDENGHVTAIKEGKTTITASIAGESKTFTIHVEKTTKRLELDKTIYAMPENGTLQVTASAFRNDVKDENALIVYAIEDESVATVSKDGTLTAMKSGETTLTVSYGTVIVTANVTIYTETTAANVNTFAKEYVNTYGRTYITNSKLNLDHVASGVEVAIVGTSLTVKLNATATMYIRVFVDGAAEGKRIEVCANQNTYEVATGLTDGYHKIRIVKSSELFDGQIDILSFSAEKFALPPQRGKIKIEFIGDSITAGYGVLGSNGQPRTVQNSDGCYSFAYRTAQKLNADYSTIAVQGICAKALHWQKSWNMYSLYQKVSANYNSAAYAFDFQPDVVILGLGTNEASYLGPNYGGSTYGAQFPADYKDMLTLVREKNPNAYIVCVYGMMGDNTVISNGIKSAIQSMNDAKISYSAFSSEMAGANNHPSKNGQENFATRLAEIINDLFKEA